jgi:cephalosporin-C deacetylase
MSAFDLPLADLRAYRPEPRVPSDFDEFWAATLRGSRGAPAVFSDSVVATELRGFEVRDLRFRGFDGDPVNAWYVRPVGATEPLPVVIEFLGYGGGRGFAHERLSWPGAGYAYVVMDTRGQGGVTDDPHGSGPGVPGYLTRGILSADTFYYRRVFTDAVRCVDAVRELDGIDAERIVVSGTSQGGGIALAVAGLRDDLRAALIDLPFLCHFDRAIGLTDRPPYSEVVRYLAAHRGDEARVRATLAYVDGLHHATRASAPALFSVALHDATCPPSTVFATFHAYAERVAASEIVVYPFNDHEGGAGAHWPVQAAWLRELA